MSLSDHTLDAKLRAVPVPEGLMKKLRAIPLADDEALDAAICDVPIPAGLLSRLRRVPLADDDGLDAALRDVPVPVRLTAWRRRASRRDRFTWMSRLATAVSLLVAVSLTFCTAILISLVVNRPSLPLAQRSPAEAALGTESLAESWASAGAEEKAAAGPPALPPEIAMAKIEDRHGQPTPSDLGAALDMPRSDDPLLRPSSMLSPGLLGDNAFDVLPELPKRGSSLVPRGISWPLVSGSNSAFLIRWRVHPFVSPADSPRLQTSTVPLGVDSASYELTRRYLEDGELPPPDPDVIRPEGFLAAVDYDFPRPEKQALGLWVAGGPSPFGGEGKCLLQIGVQSRELDSRGHAPIQLILAVDTSASMRWGSRIEILRRALRDFASHMEGDDRLSLVSFNQAAHVLIQDAGPEEVRHFLAAVDSLSADGSTDVAAGLSEAFLLARQLSVAGRPPVRVILLSDGLLDLDRRWMERIEHGVAEAAGRGVRLEVVDLGQQKQDESQMAPLARSGGGTVRRAANAHEVGWALREIVTGQSELTARDVELRVTFQPKSVLEYRLLGHEAKEWAGLLPGSPRADFHDGQAATALYEVRLAAQGPKDVAAVELTWYAADSKRSQGQMAPQKLTRRVELTDFASSWSGTEASLQEAALVAQAAEVLRRSPFALARNPRTSTAARLARISDLAGTVDSRLYQRPSFVEFVSLVDQAIKAKPARNGSRRP